MQTSRPRRNVKDRGHFDITLYSGDMARAMKTQTCLFTRMMDKLGGAHNVVFFSTCSYNRCSQSTIGGGHYCHTRCLHSTLGGDIPPQVAVGTLQ